MLKVTDSLQQLLLIEDIEAYHIKGKSHDCGTKLGYLMANVEYTLRCGRLGADFKEQLVNYLVKENKSLKVA